MGNRSNGNGFKVPLIGQKPVEQRLRLEFLKTPNAFPVSQIVPEPDGAKLMMFGGLNQLQWMAGQVAAGVGNWDADAPTLFVDAIVTRAAAILEECEERVRRVDPLEASDGEELT